MNVIIINCDRNTFFLKYKYGVSLLKVIYRPKSVACIVLTTCLKRNLLCTILLISGRRIFKTGYCDIHENLSKNFIQVLHQFKYMIEKFNTKCSYLYGSE